MLRRADARFLLTVPPRSSATVGDVDGWQEALRALRIDDVGEGSVPNLVVARSSHARAAVARGADAVILEGRGRRRELVGAGYEVRRFLAVPNQADAEFLIPLDQPSAARYAVERALPDRRGWKSVRNRVVGGLLGRGVLPAVGPVVSVGQRHAGQPFLVAAATELGVAPDARWYVALGQRGDDYRRGTFMLFPDDDRVPRWVVKFARVPGYARPFDYEENALRLAAAAGPNVRPRVPELLGRFTVDGIEASVERAATGWRLDHVLGSSEPPSAKLRVIDAVAEWALELARAETDQSRAAERVALLARDVLPQWLPGEQVQLLEARLATVPVVLQHQDLGSYNVITAGADFTVLDWEGARPDGLPLWDVVHFLFDALARLDGATDSIARRDEHAVRLFRGELPSSAVLFRWVREAVSASKLAPDSVAALVTGLWLAIGSHFLEAQERPPAVGSERHQALPPPARFAAIWLETPGLGLGWRSWLE